MTDPVSARERAELWQEIFDAVDGRWYALPSPEDFPNVLALVEENERLESYFADVFDGSPQDFVEGYKEMEGENERLRGALREIQNWDYGSFSASADEAAMQEVARAALVVEGDE